jgi:ketosteroid isomerase-like protein
MSLQIRIPRVAVALALLSFVHVSMGSAQPEVLTNEQTRVAETVNTLFTALKTEDAGKMNSILAPGFYAFDNGARFDGRSMMSLVKALHAAGKRYEWSVTNPDVHIRGDAAWIAYLNEGSITDASGQVRQQWLESAFLEKQSGVWKIVFLQSTRVPKPTTNGG